MNLLKSNLVVRYGNFLSRQISIDEQNLMIDFLEEDKKACLLDLGCFDGVRTTEFIQKIKPAKTYGIDIVSYFLNKAEKKGIIVKKADLNKKFPLISNSMDVVITSHAIEHLTDTDNFLQEIKRVLKPKGYVVVATDNLAGWFNVLSLIFGYQPAAGPTVSKKYLVTLNPLWWEQGEGGLRDIKWPMHHNVMTMKTLEFLLRKYGFKIEKVKGSGYPPVPYPLASFFTNIDLYHSMFTVIKARKI